MEQDNRTFDKKELKELSDFIELIDPNDKVFSKSKEEIEKLKNDISESSQSNILEKTEKDENK